MRKRGFTIAILFVLGLKLALATGAGNVAVTWIENAVTSGSLISASLRHEYGEPALETIAEIEPTPEPTQSPIILETSPFPTPEPTSTPEIVTTHIYNDVSIDNNTSFSVDAEALMQAGLSQTLPSEGVQILIIHTHGTESYTPEAGADYEESDYARTINAEYNVIKLGDILTEKFTQMGLCVIHDREYYDYPSYTGSYTRSEEAITSYLAQYPEIAVVIDIHRDAIGDGDVVYKTAAEIPNVLSSQLMFVMGTGENGLYHPQWQENLKLALAMQEALDEKYPSLMRPLVLAQERYNQQLTTGSMILEVGSNGNTISEAIVAIELFAEVAGPMLLELVE